jgi:cytochrome c
MADAPPKFLKGPTVAALLLLAIALTVVAVIRWTRPTETEIVDKVEAPPADPQPLNFYLARADVARGEAYFSHCAPCHTIAPGGPPSIGPNLYGVMGGAIASRPGYNYSGALRDKGGSWDWEAANRFLRLPRSFAPGTKMTFVGVLDPQDRADVMLYLNRQGGSLPMPAGAH